MMAVILILIPPALGLLAGLFAWLGGDLHIPTWAWWLGGGVTALGLLANAFGGGETLVDELIDKDTLDALGPVETYRIGDSFKIRTLEGWEYLVSQDDWGYYYQPVGGMKIYANQRVQNPMRSLGESLLRSVMERRR